MIPETVANAAAAMDEEIGRLNEQIRKLLLPRPARRRVLLVDDNCFVDQMAVNLQYLLPRDIEVTYCEEAERAADLAKHEGPWDLAILDLYLGHPRLTGLDILELLPRSTRVILITGVTPDQLPSLSRATRVESYLTKPFSPQQLASRVAELLRSDTLQLQKAV